MPRRQAKFERTLIIADDDSYVSYLEGCTAPIRDQNQLHAAVVELVALDNVQIKYSTVQNWYPGDKEGRGGIYNFVAKRGKCQGRNFKISWTQVETTAPRIAKALGISSQTLRNHLHHINQKLRTHNRLEAVMHALHRRLI
jgi:Fe-S cluster assembly scaffold protein SufB